LGGARASCAVVALCDLSFLFLADVLRVGCGACCDTRTRTVVGNGDRLTRFLLLVGAFPVSPEEDLVLDGTAEDVASCVRFLRLVVNRVLSSLALDCIISASSLSLSRCCSKEPIALRTERTCNINSLFVEQNMYNT